MPAHPQKAAVVLAVLADEHGLDRRLHVVVDAARAGALEEDEGGVVRVEHHLLGLARIGPYEQHPAVAQPDMRHLDGDRRAVDQHDLVRPVELVGLSGAKLSGPKASATRHRARRATSSRTAEPRHSCPCSRTRAAPRKSGSASSARAPAYPRSPAIAPRADRATG